jgi:Tfp pilus assembly protein PilX
MRNVTARHSGRRAGTPASQRGVVLFIALIVLVAMTLAGIAVMRSVDANNLIAGNLAMRNAATSAGDAGLEYAREWLKTKTAGFLEDDSTGYYANWQDPFDHTAFNWASQAVNLGNDGHGNNIYYVIHRMCKESGKSINATDCFKKEAEASGGSKGGDEGSPPTPVARAYFRITAKVVGPRNTVSYVQSFVY